MRTNIIGQYKNNYCVGGDFRIGVDKKFQGKGLGRICIVHTYSRLADKGINVIESAISFKRKESLYLHYALGFRPQLKYSRLAFKTSRFKKFKLFLSSDK